MGLSFSFQPPVLGHCLTLQGNVTDFEKRCRYLSMMMSTRYWVRLALIGSVNTWCTSVCRWRCSRCGRICNNSSAALFMLYEEPWLNSWSTAKRTSMMAMTSQTSMISAYSHLASASVMSHTDRFNTFLRCRKETRKVEVQWRNPIADG